MQDTVKMKKYKREKPNKSHRKKIERNGRKKNAYILEKCWPGKNLKKRKGKKQEGKGNKSRVE